MGFVADAAKSVGGALGFGTSEGKKENKKALELFNNIQDPEIKQLALQRYSVVADPRDFLTALQDSDFKNIKEDPAFKGAQMSALNRFQSIADQGGLTAQDQKLLNDIKTQEKVTEQGQRQAITQNAQQRGVAGSGLELASQLGAEQSGAQSAAQRGTDVAAQAADRQMQAAQLAGQLGTQVRGQEYGMKSDAAKAQDIINQFNTSAKNEAGLAAFQNQQNAANQNVGLANQQTMYNNTIPQQQFANQMDLANAKAAALNRIGAAQDTYSGRLAQIIGGGVQGYATGMGGK